MTPTRARLAAAFGGVGTALLVLVPSMGFAFVALGTMLAGRARVDRDWTIVWLAFAVPVGGSLLLLGENASAARVLGQAALGFAAAALLRPAARVALRGLAGGLVLIGAVLVLVQLAAPYLWNNWAYDNSFAHMVQRVVTGSEAVSGGRTRTWILSDAGGSAEVSLPIRLLEGTTGWGWTRNGHVRIEQVRDPAGVHALLAFGSEGDPYAQRTFDLGAPAGGRTFRVEFELRSSRPLAARGCRGVWLQVWGQGGGSSCKAVAAGPEWRRIEHEWTVPPEAASGVVRVVLNDFDGETIETRDVRLLEVVPDGMLPLAPLTPEGVSVHMRWEGGSRTTAVLPTAAWTDVRLSIPAAVTAGDGRLSVGLIPGPGQRIAVGPVVFEGVHARPTSRPLRPGLWLGHPNFVAYTVAAAGLVALVLAQTGPVWRALALLTATGVLLAGSRAAFAIFLGAAVALHLFRAGGRRIRTLLVLLPLLLVAAGAIGLSLLGNQQVSSLLPFNQGQATSRTAIWGSAVEAAIEHPWGGLVGAQSDFVSWWRERGTTRESVRHAHNVLLEYASSFGLPGLVSISALAAGLLLLATRRGGRRGLILAGAFLAMNLVDTTLFYGGVLFPLVLGINVLAEPSAPNGRQVS